VNAEPTEQQLELLEKLARKVVALRASAMAIFVLEATKPLSFLGSQTMVFFQPIIQTFFEFKDYDNIQEMLENRGNIERLIERIETLQDEQIQEEKRLKKEKKARQRGRR
jgi:hypothetical protein